MTRQSLIELLLAGPCRELHFRVKCVECEDIALMPGERWARGPCTPSLPEDSDFWLETSLHPHAPTTNSTEALASPAAENCGRVVALSSGGAKIRTLPESIEHPCLGFSLRFCTPEIPAC